MVINVSIVDDWQLLICDHYPDDDMASPISQFAMRMILELGEIGSSRIRESFSGAAYPLAQMSYHLFALCCKLGLQLSVLFCKRFPGMCPFCVSNPCMCMAVSSPRVALSEWGSISNNQSQSGCDDVRKLTITSAQELITELYFNKALDSPVSHLVQVLHSSIAYAWQSIEKNSTDSEPLLADIFANVLILASKLDIELEDALSNLNIGDIRKQLVNKKESESDSGKSELEDLWDIVCKAGKRTKGKALEDYAFTLFETVPSFIVNRNILTDTSEFDLIIRINPEKEGGLYWERYQPLIFVECKNLANPTDQGEISKMFGKVMTQTNQITTNLIFFLSMSRFSGPALQQARYAFQTGYLIVPITFAELQYALEQGDRFDEFLREIVDRSCMRLKSFPSEIRGYDEE